MSVPTQSPPPKPYRLADIHVWHMRRYRDPAQEAAFNADVEANGQRVAAVLAEIGGELVLADGHCRFAALKAAGRDTILAYVDARITTRVELAAFLFATEVRSGRHPLCLAEQVEALLEATGLTQGEAAQALRLSPTKASHVLGLLEYPPHVRALFASNAVTLGHHVEVASLPLERRIELLTAVPENRTTTRQLKAIAHPKPKAHSATLKLRAGGIVVSLPRKLPISTLRSSLKQLGEMVDEKLKGVTKTQIQAGEIFT